jgi:hypothetical protein
MKRQTVQMCIAFSTLALLVSNSKPETAQSHSLTSLEAQQIQEKSESKDLSPGRHNSSSSSVENLPNGNYNFCAEEQIRERDCFTSFTFTKVDDNVVGIYRSGPLHLCIEGKINNNTISGWGLESSHGPSREPAQTDPRFRTATLANWDQYLKAGSQRVFNLRFDNYGRTGSTRFQAWWRYDSALLNLNDFTVVESSNQNNSERCQVVNRQTEEVIGFDQFSR